MKAHMIAMTVFVVPLGLPGALCAQESEPMSVIDAWVTDLTAGDIDAALS